MGSGRDKRKKAKGHVPGQGAEKTAKKTEKNEGKAQRRTEKRAQVRVAALCGCHRHARSILWKLLRGRKLGIL